MVVAEDSGIPPRRASVAVVVRFAKEVSARIRGDDGGALVDSGLLFVIFGGLLLIFLAIILVLSAYICKSKRKGRGGSVYGSNILGSLDGPKLGGSRTTYLPPELRREPSLPSVGNPVYRRGDNHVLANGNVSGSRPGSASSRRSSVDTLSSVAPPSSGPQAQITHHLGVALNPLNPRSSSQRYGKNSGMLRLTTSSSKVSPTLGMIPPPPPTPSIHSSGLPEPPTPISADPNGRSASSAGYAQVHKRGVNGAIPKYGGSINSVASASGSASASAQNSLARSVASESSLQQALRENILAATVAVTTANKQASADHQHSLTTRIQWPRNSIPRRVKKLSWEDEGSYGTTSRDRDISTLTDPNVSVTPLKAEAADAPHQIGRAIYF